jgi:Domain of unknown function (DUF397)
MSSNEIDCSLHLAWRTASFCQSGECIQVAQRDGLIILRDSTRPRGTLLHYDAGIWRCFIRDVKAGEFDDLRS